jgi:hypothetical protein
MGSMIHTVRIERTDDTGGGRARAERVIRALRMAQTVRTADAGAWKALVVDQPRSGALDLIRAEMTEIDPGWTEVLAVP